MSNSVLNPMIHLTGPELQELTLMVGSRSGLMTYLGLNRKDFDLLWKKHWLHSPVDYVRSLPRETVTSTLIRQGSMEKASEWYGVSATFLRVLLGASVVEPPRQSLSEKVLERYGSVRLTARMTGHKESEVRKFVKAHKAEHLLRYDFSSHNNAKGRRAETHWASLQDSGMIIEDCNVTQGPQHPFDYVHAIHGNVNVKSSKAHRYTAQSRRSNPLYWKISARSLDKCDTLALVLYDTKMQVPLHVFQVPVTKEMIQSTSIRCQIVNGQLDLQYSKR